MAHGRSNGYSENVYFVNIPPRHGRCSVDKPRGYSDKTVFNFMCEGWIDKDLPLSYEFQYQTRYGVVFLLHHGLLPVFSTSLPIGDVEANFTLDFRVKIFDAQGTYKTTRVDVQVQYGPLSICRNWPARPVVNFRKQFITVKDRLYARPSNYFKNCSKHLQNVPVIDFLQSDLGNEPIHLLTK